MYHVVDKPWGMEEILTTQERYVVKRIHMNKGHRCSLQYHEYKIETIYILSGVLLLYLKDMVTTMNPGDFCTIFPGDLHRMEGKEDAIYLEVSTHELDDIIRVEDDYGRE